MRWSVNFDQLVVLRAKPQLAKNPVASPEQWRYHTEKIPSLEILVMVMIDTDVLTFPIDSFVGSCLHINTGSVGWTEFIMSIITCL